MLLDWVFCPYNSKGVFAREAEACFDLVLRRWDITQIRDASISLLPKHIAGCIKSVRSNDEKKETQGAKPCFFLEGEEFPCYQNIHDFFKAIEHKNMTRSREPVINELFVHPRLPWERRDQHILVLPVTAKDIAGYGLPTPSMKEDVRFGDIGNPETLEFMTLATRSYGKMMSIAFIGSDVAGYITHVPKPLASRMGCKFVDEMQDKGIMQIIDLYVYPQFREEGVEKSLIANLAEFCRKNRHQKIEVYTLETPVEDYMPSTGHLAMYDGTGFKTKKTIKQKTQENKEHNFVLMTMET
ncbi:MAG TPA: GNAT family N-acetyltransferase [Caldisericia bacterium]|nr:MAG: hypothetical protein BWX90_01247 [bacterium ADurb.Bin132]HNY61427.1 GNAT family N-acetyltransferase [Caldisericia bacterium]HOC79555.1 GNAT family N-acetyltransferase [Caldisericia bacterium]HOG70430.1 GNAT family N-acetyltransferase [Caldisericia bacterium]HPA65807.1 GNAT family N-acetyltransferase [Caldisericia bacterium]